VEEVKKKRGGTVEVINIKEGIKVERQGGSGNEKNILIGDNMTSDDDAVREKIEAQVTLVIK
jgi:hypothetical protein